MNTVKYILGLPEHVKGIGNVYPVKVKDYDFFMENVDILMYSKQHFSVNGDYPLLDLLLIGFKNKEIIINKLKNIFELVLKKSVSFAFTKTQYGFLIDESGIIDSSNYEKVREVILKQNLQFEPKVYKNKITQEWATKVLEAKAKRGIKITIEDKITTVATYKGLTYDQVAEMTIYQLEASFARINKIMEYNTSIQTACAGASNVEINHFAEYIDMFESPWDSIFVSKNKLSKLNESIKNKEEF